MEKQVFKEEVATLPHIELYSYVQNAKNEDTHTREKAEKKIKGDTFGPPLVHNPFGLTSILPPSLFAFILRPWQ